MSQANGILRRIPKYPITKCSTSAAILKATDYHISSIRFVSNKNIKTALFEELSKPIKTSQNKVSIIGVDQIGIAAAVGLLAKNVTSEIALFDANKKRLQGEMLDLKHASNFLNNPKVRAGSNLSITKNSQVCVLTVGETRVDRNTDLCHLAKSNTEVLRAIVPDVVKNSPNCVLVVVTPPVEAMTDVCFKLCDMSRQKIVGVGCSLQTLRLRYFMAKKYGVGVDSCKGLVIGESGPSSVWSTLAVGGFRICAINPLMGTNCDPENWSSIHQKVINADFGLRKHNRHIAWTAAANVVDIVQCILNNTRKVYSLSVPADGLYGIQQEVYASLPCVLGEGGVSDILNIPLSNYEYSGLLKAVTSIIDLQQSGTYVPIDYYSIKNIKIPI